MGFTARFWKFGHIGTKLSLHPTDDASVASVFTSRPRVHRFQQLITAPANVLSALVVEGYKKMILVSLILSGKSPTLPKYASNVVTRQLKNHTSEYDSLATLCQVSENKQPNLS